MKPKIFLATITLFTSVSVATAAPLPSGLCKSGFGKDQQGRDQCLEVDSDGEKLTAYRFGLCKEDLTAYPVKSSSTTELQVGERVRISGLKKSGKNQIVGEFYWDGKKIADKFYLTCTKKK